MEEDDDFGDLYTDVLQKFSIPQPHGSSPAPLPTSLPRQMDLNLISDPNPVASYPNSTPNDSSTSRPPVHEDHAPTRAGDVNGVGKAGELAEYDVKFDIEDGNNGVLNDDVAVIPGIGKEFVVKAEKNDSGGGTGSGNGEVAVGQEEEGWDSDSDDDLQIVLNDEKHRPMVIDEGGGDDDDDDDEEDGDPLVIVDDVDANNQGLLMEEENWGGAEAGGDEVAAAGGIAEGGVEKEAGDRVNVAGAGSVTAAAAKTGYSNHYGYHNPYHSQFKYVRPGAAPIPGPTTVGSSVAPDQVRPLVNVGLVAGRGRGDWRPAGLKNAPPMQRGFPGMPGPCNNMAGRGFGVGLEFTLPSHKTIFDVDIDGFEEKPWKYPGVDVSDFFNFGLTEESWKDYCKQLEQHRLETTMQSKIRVYESGRTDQEYDPDLPPELAAATGILDVSGANIGKSDVGQSDLAKAPARIRPPIPTGRAIQVEGGYGERLPSIDTRPPRIRDSDAIIEIVCQDSVDDESSVGNGDQENDLAREDLIGGSHAAEDEIAPVDSGYFDGFSGAFDGQKRELIGRRAPLINSHQNNMPEGEEILPLPPESSNQYHPGSRGQTSKYPGENVGTSYEESRIQGRTRDGSPCLTPSQSPRSKNFLDNQGEESVESMQGKHNPSSSPVVARGARELSVENNDMHDELVPGDGRSAMDKEETNTITTGDTHKDGNSLLSTKKQKMDSQVEQPDLECDDDEDSRAARSSEDSKARSGSSRDYKKWRDAAEEEVMQGSHSTRMGNVKKHVQENEQSFRRKDREGRQDIERYRMAAKEREGSYPNRDLDPSMVHHVHMKTEGFDRRKERENPDAAWQRRDDDPYSRKNRTEDSRKREREHGDDMGPKHRSKARQSERSDKDEHHYSRKQLDNGSYRVHYDKDPSSWHRERDDNLKGRYEMLEDYISKRRKNEEYLRRDYTNKDESLHGPRDSTSRRKRERDDVLELRKRDDQQRIRENFDDHHSVRHKDEVWLQRERGEGHRDRDRDREEWHRLKPPHEELRPKSKREDGRGAVRTGHSSEDKAWPAHARMKDDYKGSDKEYQLKDSARQSELKRRERIEDENFSNHQGREDVYAQGNQFNNEERKLRQERSAPQNDRAVNASDNSRVTEKKNKESTRKNKESEGGGHNSSVASRRNQDDRSGHSSEMGLKGAFEQGNGENEKPVQRNSSRKQNEEVSSDNERQDSRRGRSKLERWTSHKERDFSINSKSSASLKCSDIDRNKNGFSLETIKCNEESATVLEPVKKQHSLADEKDFADPETKGVDTKLLDDRHLDTVEKLKKRSERFKLPMPGEKDTVIQKEGEALPSAKPETQIPADSEIKPERPARKRRWISN